MFFISKNYFLYLSVDICVYPCLPAGRCVQVVRVVICTVETVPYFCTTKALRTLRFRL